MDALHSLGVSVTRATSYQAVYSAPLPRLSKDHCSGWSRVSQVLENNN